MKVWDRAGIELTTPGSAVRLAFVARRDVTDCAARPSYPSVIAYVLDAQKNSLTETVHLSTQNICFG